MTTDTKARDEDGAWRLPLAVMLHVGLLVAVGGPLLVIVVWSFSDGWFAPDLLPEAWTFDHWTKILDDQGLFSAAVRSTLIALVVMALSGVLALPTAWAMARHPFRLKRAIELFLLAPMMIPGLVVAIGLGHVFLGAGLSNTLLGVVLAQTVGTLPLTIRLATAAFEAVPEDLILAARSLGAGPLRAIVLVVLPVALPSLAAAGLLAFVHSFEEFDRTFIVGAPLIETLPVKLFFLLDGAGIRYPTAAVVSLVLLAPVILVFVIAGRIVRNDVMSAGVGKL